MRLVAESGLWSTGPLEAPTPLVALLEVSGAVLSWTVDDPAGVAATRISFTDPRRADWLWRVVGESGHVAVAAAVEERAAEQPQVIELDGVAVVPGAVEPLRRLAIGHWLRRWWPASNRDAIARLDGALLDAELALLTSAADDFFTDDTLDSDLVGLLAPHPGALTEHLRGGDPRVVELARACVEVADAVGTSGSGWFELAAALDRSSGPDIVVEDLARSGARRDDYALAAGADARGRSHAAIGGGVGSIKWGAVPPGIFDAAENTVDWTIEAAGSDAVALVRAAIIGPRPATGVAVRVWSGTVTGTGVLDADGRATLPLVDPQQRAMTETAAWGHDWSTTSVTVGADVEESEQTRERIRHYARARLAQPPNDAFLAEILATESDY